jgi:hypothetical protein
VCEQRRGRAPRASTPATPPDTTPAPPGRSNDDDDGDGRGGGGGVNIVTVGVMRDSYDVLVSRVVIMANMTMMMSEADDTTVAFFLSWSPQDGRERDGGWRWRGDGAAV